MKINIIAAMSINRVIGKDNTLPRHYSEDLQHFKKITTGKIIVMGYKTYLSLGKPLPNRRNIVLSYAHVEGIESYTSIEMLLETLNSEGVDEIFIIGGATLYQQFLPLADTVYLTEIKKAYVGDTYFPIFEDQFTEVGREKHEEMDFVLYKKNTN